MCISRSNPSSAGLEVQDLNIVKEALKSKQQQMVSQIRWHGQLLSAKFFEAFPKFHSFRIF